MNSAADPSPEGIFGPYEVFERLGMGGMAMVHRAKKRGIEGFERSVALKRMLQHLAEDGNFVDSFIREAKVASLLHHPNIAQVYDFGRIGGVYYIAMELVSGFDVRKLLRYASKTGEPIPLPVILSILGELADALEYAHSFVDEQGTPLKIVHRDISPSNLIIAHTGHLKVIDFGIAKANSRQLQTESGQVKGKLGYMSPEAAHGMTLDPVSDIFSMGVVAWELVTASPLFSARTDFETMRRIREADIVPPSLHNPNCPPELDSIIVAALDREPAHRLPSAAVFRAALDALATQHGIHHSARSVAEWVMRFAQPGDTWMRSSQQPARSQPIEQPTSVLRARARTPSAEERPSARLKRSAEQAALAGEIWGDDGAPPASGPDFSHVVSRPQTTPPMRPLPIMAPPSEPRIPSFSPNTGPVLPALHASLDTIQPLSPSQPRLAVSPSQLAPPIATPAPKRSKLPIVVLGVLAVVAGVLGAVLVIDRDKPAPATATTGPVKFVVEPAGAVIEIAGREASRESPYQAELDPGVYSVKVLRDGYRPWQGTITVRAGDPQTVNVALERGMAKLSIDSDPRGLPIDLDGKPSGFKTPAKLDVEAGPHDLAVTNAGDTWTEHVVAAVDGSYAFTAKLAFDKPVTPGHPKKVAVAEHKPKQPEVTEPRPEVQEPPPPDAAPEPVKPVEPPPDPTPPPKGPDKPARTPVVAASAVTKLAGELPTLKGQSGASNGDVLVKMCIDETGKVTSVKIVKSSADVAADLSRALSAWRYKPYLNKDKQPSPVCFPLSLRLVFKNG